MKYLTSLLLVLMLSFFLSACTDHDKEDDEEMYRGTTVKDSQSAWYDAKATYTSYGVRNGGRQAWRIPAKGPSFGRQIKVVFSDGHTVFVKDTKHNYREGDGFVFKPGIGPNGTGDANTGTAHGGVYLHAPYGNRSTQVRFFYKR